MKRELETGENYWVSASIVQGLWAQLYIDESLAKPNMITNRSSNKVNYLMYNLYQDTFKLHNLSSQPWELETRKTPNLMELAFTVP